MRQAVRSKGLTPCDLRLTTYDLRNFNLHSSDERRKTVVQTKRAVPLDVSLVLALFLSGGTLISPALSQDFQNTLILLRASQVLPKDPLSGPNYKIKEAVINDGLINIYELDTFYGPLRVESTPLLLKRINELKGLEHMEALK